MTAVEHPVEPESVSEDDVVSAIAALLDGTAGTNIRVGIGDDAAVWQSSRSHRSVITTDMAVEGVHFTSQLMRLQDAGWRSMIANASDIAAMGARPVLATVALGVPVRAAVADVLLLYAGLAEAARSTRLSIVGGDLSRAPAWTVAITAVGEVRASNLKTRSGGGPGCVLCSTGALGASRAGFDIARRQATIEETQSERALATFRRPVARMAEGRFLGADRAVAAMMDCSDGLSTDIARLARASGCAARIDEVPVDPAAAAVATQLGVDPEQYALAGGEDFELLVAVRKRDFERLSRRFAARFGTPLHRIGVLVPGAGVEFAGAPLRPTGWDHLAGLG
ncbi:MAG TPA: thiamine-phosphate kinase [Candidatus Tumulicola sp.]|jgi:thiamine-monophosphate kinase